MVLFPEPFPRVLLVVHALPSFPRSPQVLHLSAFPLKQAAISWCVSAAPAALSFKEEKVQRDRRNNLYHFWLSDISPCSCHSPCLLSWCYCKQPCMCLHFQSSDWLEMAEGGGIEACLDVMLVCTSFKLSSACSFSVNHLFLFFFLFYFSGFEYFPPLMLSTGWVLQSGVQHLWI